MFVLDAGIKLLEQDRAELLYLLLSDLVQHAHGPGDVEANAFHSTVDAKVSRLAELGAVVGLIADHGMNDKTNEDGTPRVVFREEELNRRFEPDSVRVICPITDPFVKHHGRIVCAGLPAQRIGAGGSHGSRRCNPGIAFVLDGKSAASRYQMPLDIVGHVGTSRYLSERPNNAGRTRHILHMAVLSGVV